MEFNRVTVGVGLLILLGLAFVYVWKPTFTPTALLSSAFKPTSNPFLSKVTNAIETNFADNPQAVIEQGNRVGLVFPGGTSVQFAIEPGSTDQDVVIILNASLIQLPNANTYPAFVSNQFTYVSPSELGNENPYVQALYPHGLYLMPISVEK